MLRLRTPADIWRGWTSPTVDGDLAQRREAVLLNVLATFVVFGMLAFVEQIGNQLVGPGNDHFWFWWPLLGLTTLGFYALLRCARAGGHRTSAALLIGILSTISVLLLVDDGVNDSVWPLLAAVAALLASILIGGRAALAVAGLLASAAVLCAGLEEHGWLVPIQKENTTTLGGSLAPVLLIAMITRACSLYTREILTGIDDVLSHGAQRSPLRQLRTKDLTVREIEVVQLVAEGLTNDEIAKRLFLSPRTVQSHVASALGKTECANRTALGVLAIREGLVPLDGLGRDVLLVTS